MSSIAKINVLWMDLGTIESFTAKELMKRCNKPNMFYGERVSRFITSEDGNVGYILLKGKNYPLEDMDQLVLSCIHASRPFLCDAQGNYYYFKNIVSVAEFLGVSYDMARYHFKNNGSIKSRNGIRYKNVLHSCSEWPWEYGQSFADFQEYDSVIPPNISCKKDTTNKDKHDMDLDLFLGKLTYKELSQKYKMSIAELKHKFDNGYKEFYRTHNTKEE